jgi:hypothetical protein
MITVALSSRSLAREGLFLQLRLEIGRKAGVSRLSFDARKSITRITTLTMKKFHLHLDALIVLAVVVAASLAMNYYQYLQYQELARENRKLTSDGFIANLNLGSCQSALEKRIAESKSKKESPAGR